MKGGKLFKGGNYSRKYGICYSRCQEIIFIVGHFTGITQLSQKSVNIFFCFCACLPAVPVNNILIDLT